MSFKGILPEASVIDVPIFQVDIISPRLRQSRAVTERSRELLHVDTHSDDTLKLPSGKTVRRPFQTPIDGIAPESRLICGISLLPYSFSAIDTRTLGAHKTLVARDRFCTYR